ncbi:MAG: hypothetical protein QXQ90_03110 [Desulfurococcaceae archaeon]
MKVPKVAAVAPRLILLSSLEMQRSSGSPAPTPRLAVGELAPQPVTPPPTVTGVVAEAPVVRTAPPFPIDAEAGELVAYAVTPPSPSAVVRENARAAARGV